MDRRSLIKGMAVFPALADPLARAIGLGGEAIAQPIVVLGERPGSPFPGPEIIARAAPTKFPPAPAYTFNAYHAVGDRLRIQAASDFAFTAPSLDDATIVLTGTYAADKAAINARLAGIGQGVHFIRARIERAGAASRWSNVVQHGTAEVPAMIGGTAFQVAENQPLAVPIKLSGPAYLEIAGDDALHLELVGTQPGTDYVLRFLDDATKDYEKADDFNLDHAYAVRLVRRGLNGQSAASFVTVEVTYFDTTPDAFSFEDVAGAAPSAVYEATTTVIAGMAPNVAAAIALTGNWINFRIHDGKAWGPYLTDTDGVTVKNGYRVGIRQQSSPRFETVSNARLTVGGMSDSFTVTTSTPDGRVSVTLNPEAKSPQITLSNGNRTATSAPYQGAQLVRATYGLSPGAAGAFQVTVDRHSKVVGMGLVWSSTPVTAIVGRTAGAGLGVTCGKWGWELWRDAANVGQNYAAGGADGDVWRLEMAKGGLTVKRNGAVLGTIPIPPDKGKLFPAVTFVSDDATAGAATVDFKDWA